MYHTFQYNAIVTLEKNSYLSIHLTVEKLYFIDRRILPRSFWRQTSPQRGRLRWWERIGRTLYDFCTAKGMSALLEQWDVEKNAPITPHSAFCASNRMAWWQCARGHSWQARIASRAQDGVDCPYCKGKRAVPGETDLASRFPEVAAQWDAARNGELTPQTLLPSSNRAVWWLCEKNHSYRATVAHRTREGSACPYCAGRSVLPGFNDLATLFPRLAGQWHPTLNGALTPEMVTAGSHQPVWWQCGEGHVWKAKVYSRTDARQCGCPVCTGRVRKTM